MVFFAYLEMPEVCWTNSWHNITEVGLTRALLFLGCEWFIRNFARYPRNTSLEII